MSNLVWKLNRLRAMGPSEVAHRLGDAVRQRWQARGHGLALRPPAPSLARFGRAWLPLDELPADPAPYVAAAERILAGRFDVFALRDSAIGFPPQWNRDPKTGRQAPLLFGKTLNYRDEVLVGDIKCLWEPNRHLALSDLAMAYRLNGEQRYADGVRVLLDSWLQQCPYPLGPNWSSALEAALRLISWSLTWQLLGGVDCPLFAGEAGGAFLRRWLDSIYQHCHFVAGHFSRHSSANNHLFGELTGLQVAALTWPCWPASAGWLERSAAELECEALRQNGADGVNREQAIYYQHSVADEMLLCVLAGRANDAPRSAAFLARLEKMLEFIAGLMNVAGQLPMIGDADDALLVRFGKETGWDPYRSLLASGAVLFGRAEFKAKAGRYDDKSLWLLGSAGRERYAALGATGAVLPRAFPEGGYFVMGVDLDGPAEVRLIADAGPLGYLGIAAHGHADALAITLSIAGSAVLVDPGTYAYHTQKVWRDYFRGTSAHNTVRVDGLDQSESGGNFLWLRKAVARCEEWRSDSAGQLWCASHDGYRRLADPVIHRRSINWPGCTGGFVVEDELACRGNHQIEWFWHVDPACKVSLDGAGVRISGAGFTLRIAMPGADCRAELVRGGEQPPLGWVAPLFDQKKPSTTIVWRENITGSVRRRTEFEFVVGQDISLF